jgi:PE family
MSFVIASPEYVTAAASDLASIGSSISEANSAAAAPTTGVLAAGADEVSAVVTTLFEAHAQAYQALSAQAATFHNQFVQLLNAGAGQYAATEAASASPLKTLQQDLLNLINAPTEAPLDRPLIGNGVSAAAGTGASGQAGGLLWGNGGNGGSGGASHPNGGNGGAAGLFGTGGTGGAGGFNGGAGGTGGILFGTGGTGGNAALISNGGDGRRWVRRLWRRGRRGRRPAAGQHSQRQARRAAAGGCRLLHMGGRNGRVEQRVGLSAGDR